MGFELFGQFPNPAFESPVHLQPQEAKGSTLAWGSMAPLQIMCQQTRAPPSSQQPWVDDATTHPKAALALQHPICPSAIAGAAVKGARCVPQFHGWVSSCGVGEEAVPSLALLRLESRFWSSRHVPSCEPLKGKRAVFQDQAWAPPAQGQGGYRASSPSSGVSPPQLRARNRQKWQQDKPSPLPRDETPYRPPVDDHHQREGGVEGTLLERLLLAGLNQAALLRPVGIQQERGLEAERASPGGKQLPTGAWKRQPAKGVCPALALRCGALGPPLAGCCLGNILTTYLWLDS